MAGGLNIVLSNVSFPVPGPEEDPFVYWDMQLGRGAPVCRTNGT